MFLDTLWSLLDSGMFDTSGPVNNALIGSIASILESQNDEGDSLINNLSPGTSDINGIAMWEQILGLPTNLSLSLEQRQSIAAAKAYRLIGSLTKQQLTDILNLFSPTDSAEVIESPLTYQVYGQMLASEVSNMNSLLVMVRNVLPAHLQFIPAFIAVVTEEYQAQRSMRLSFTRNTWMNNGGIQSNHEFLDETAKKLDGTWLLNDTGQPDFDVLKLLNIAVTRIISYATSAGRTASLTWNRVINEQLNVQATKGISVTRNTWANNGGINSTHKIMDETIQKMDGSWNLDDAGHSDFDVIHSIQMSISKVISLSPSVIKTNSIAVTRQSTEQFSTSQQKGISVNRVVTALSQQTLLTGSWNLDGSVNLNRSAYPVTVKINGTAV